MNSDETNKFWFKVLDGWTPHDYELCNRYGDTQEQEFMEEIVSACAPLIKKGDPSVWEKLDKMVLDILGIDTNVETVLIVAKQKIIRLANSENDPEKRRNIFCEKANKFILEIFDYIEPTSIKMNDYVPPFTINLSSKKYNRTVLGEDVCRGKTAKNEIQTEPGCLFNGDTVESVINENNPLKNLKFLKGINPELRENVSPSKIIIKPNSENIVSKPATSKVDVGEELNLETHYSGDNAGPSSESCDNDVAISLNIKREKGINSSSKSPILFAGPSTSESMEVCENDVANASSNRMTPFAGSRTEKLSDIAAMLGKAYDPTIWSFEHYCRQGCSDQNIQDLAVAYIKEYNMRDMLRVKEIMRRHSEEMRLATEEYKKQKKFLNNIIRMLQASRRS